MLYSLYTTPLGDIARSQGLACHFHSDFKTLSSADMVFFKSNIEAVSPLLTHGW